MHSTKSEKFEFVEVLEQVRASARQLVALQGPADEPAVEKAIANIYARINLAAPKIIWLDSAAKFRQRWRLLDLVHQRNLSSSTSKQQEFDKELARCRRNKSFNKMWLQIAGGSQEPSQTAVGYSINSQLVAMLLKKLSPQLSELFESLYGEVGKTQCEREVQKTLLRHTQLMQSILDTVGIEPRLSQQWDFTVAVRKLSEILNGPESFEPKEDSVLRENEQIHTGNLWGLWDLYWLSCFSVDIFSKDLVESQSVWNELQDWLKLLTGGMAFRFYEKYCFAYRLPIRATYDQELLLHNESKSAMEFADGAKIFAWHGTILPESLFMQRRLLTPFIINLERNIEIRRIKIEMYGWEKYLRKSKASIIDKSDRGILYSMPIRNDDPIVAVEVLNSTAEPDGSHKRYLLRVPPKTKTVTAAIAWTFYMSEGEYCPVIET